MDENGLCFLCIFFPHICIVRAYDRYILYTRVKVSFSFGFRSNYILMLTISVYIDGFLVMVIV